MSNEYSEFELHDPALVNLADYGHRHGQKTKAQVRASMALELEAMGRMASVRNAEAQASKHGAAVVKLA